MIGVIEGFGIIFIVIAVGFLLAKTKVLGDKGMFVLNKYVFYAAYPCLMYDLIAKKHVQDVLGIHFVIGIVTALATIFVFLIINKFFLKLKGSAAVFACLSGVYLNSNNIGLPVATYVLKDSTMLIPIMIFQIAILAPISLAILDYLSNKEANNGKKVSLKRIISTPVRNPLVLGVILGIVGSLFGSENINWMMIPNHVCNMIGESAIPVVLISYGMSLYGSKFFDNKKETKSVACMSILKIVIMPILTFFIVKFGLPLFGFKPSNLLVYAYVVSSTLPTAQNVFNFAVAYNKNIIPVRDTIFITTIIAPFLILGLAAIFGI